MSSGRAFIAVLALASTAPAAEADVTIAVGDVDAAQNEALAHGMEEQADDSDEPLPTGGQGAGVRGGAGAVFAKGLETGWYGRLEMEAFSTGALEGAGPVGGALVGGEFWSSPDGSGGGLPMGFFLGVRSPALFTSLGGGFQLFIVDTVKDDGGFGVYAPYGAFALGFEVPGVLRVGAEARAIYRWQWGAPDYAQVQTGISLTILQEQRAPRRPRGRARSTK